MAQPSQPIRWRYATTFFARLRGLLGQAPPGPGEALRISPCDSVHTLGMRYPIDVVFVARDGGVLKVVYAMPPWRLAVCPGAADVVELAAGQAQACGLYPGARCARDLAGEVSAVTR